MFCKKCGKEVDNDSVFCTFCGEKLIDSANDIPMPDGYNQNPNPEKIHVISSNNPKFRMTCEYCTCVFEYELSNLGYRPWYPRGFVYCPACKRPLRHNTKNQVKD